MAMDVKAKVGRRKLAPPVAEDYEFSFVPGELRSQCHRLIVSFHEMHGYPCLPDMLWKAGLASLIEKQGLERGAAEGQHRAKRAPGQRVFHHRRRRDSRARNPGARLCELERCPAVGESHGARIAWRQHPGGANLVDRALLVPASIRYPGSPGGPDAAAAEPGRVATGSDGGRFAGDGRDRPAGRPNGRQRFPWRRRVAPADSPGGTPARCASGY